MRLMTVLTFWVMVLLQFPADEAVYFAKGNADFTVYETAKTVINNQVLVMMIDRA